MDGQALPWFIPGLWLPWGAEAGLSVTAQCGPLPPPRLLPQGRAVTGMLGSLRGGGLLRSEVMLCFVPQIHLQGGA